MKRQTGGNTKRPLVLLLRHPLWLLVFFSTVMAEAQTHSADTPSAQAAPASMAGMPWTGLAGIQETVSAIMERESRMALQGTQAARTKPVLRPARQGLPQNPDSPDGLQITQQTLVADERGALSPQTPAGLFSGCSAFVVRKSSVLGAGPIVVTAFRGLVPSELAAGPYTPQGVDNYDPSATEGYFIGTDNASLGKLMIRRVSTPGGTPTISGNLSVTVPPTEYPITVPHLGNARGVSGYLDALDDRLLAAHIRNGRLWTAIVSKSTVWARQLSVAAAAARVGTSFKI
ncbi:MAG: hypothetical protein WCK89_00195 [bacterium]